MSTKGPGNFDKSRSWSSIFGDEILPREFQRLYSERTRELSSIFWGGGKERFVHVQRENKGRE